jgi:hypothetical protein
MNEAAYWTRVLRPRLVRECRAAGLRGHFERVENTVASGTPDVDYCISGRAGKVELKYAPRLPVRSTTPVLGRGKGLRKTQVRWIAKRNIAGGSVFVTIGCPRRTWVLNVAGWTVAQLQRIERMTAADLDDACAWSDTRGHTLVSVLVT